MLDRLGRDLMLRVAAVDELRTRAGIAAPRARGRKGERPR